MKLVVRLLTEMLEVRILPGEPTPLCCNWLWTTPFPFDQNVVSVPEFSRRKLLPLLQKPNVFEGKIIENVPSIQLLTEVRQPCAMGVRIKCGVCRFWVPSTLPDDESGFTAWL